MLLKTFIAALARSASGKATSEIVSKVLYKEDKILIAALKAHSPYDPNRKDKRSSTHFRDQWKAKRSRFNSSKIMAQLIITNDTPFYGQFAASGAEPITAPWYFPHRAKKTGRFTKHSGKLKAADGKIWAGGLNPGHAKTVGGVIENVLDSKTIHKLTVKLGDELVKGFV